MIIQIIQYSVKAFLNRLGKYKGKSYTRDDPHPTTIGEHYDTKECVHEGVIESRTRFNSENMRFQ